MTDPQVIDLQLPTIGLKALAWGDPDAPLALCLHGFPDTPYTWRHLGPQLAAGAGSAASGPNNSGGWYVVAPFTRGYYPSDIPADGRYGLDALMQDAIDIHTVLGADDRAVLIGHDWGAVTSNSLARSDRSPFARVVSIAVAPLEVFEAKRPPLKAVGLLGRQLTMSWYMLFHQLSALPERLLPQLVELYWRRWSPGLDATEDLQYVADAMFRPENRHAAIGYYRALLSTGKAMRRPKTADTDILYIHGRTDGCMTAQWSASLPPMEHARIEIVEGGGHFVQLEQPAEVYQLISDFIE